MLGKFIFSSVKQRILLTGEMQTSFLNCMFVCYTFLLHYILCTHRQGNKIVTLMFHAIGHICKGQQSSFSRGTIYIKTQPTSEQYCRQMLYACSSGFCFTNHTASLLCLESN